MKFINLKNKKILVLVFIILGLAILLFVNNEKNKMQPEYKITKEKEGKTDTIEEDTPTATTDPGTTTQPIEKLTEDSEFAKYWEGILKEYPWFRKQPIEKEGYRVLYVIEEKSFRIRLKISENSPEELKKKYINEALEDIEKLTGKSYENYPYYVVYTEGGN